MRLWFMNGGRRAETVVREGGEEGKVVKTQNGSTRNYLRHPVGAGTGNGGGERQKGNAAAVKSCAVVVAATIGQIPYSSK